MVNDSNGALWGLELREMKGREVFTRQLALHPRALHRSKRLPSCLQWKLYYIQLVLLIIFPNLSCFLWQLNLIFAFVAD